MIRAGFTIDNPITQTHSVVLESDAETGGRGWLLELTCVPKAAPDVAEHLHLTWTETFEIVRGTAFYKVDGVQKTAEAGDTFVVRPRQFHVHPWHAGDTKLIYRQKNDFGQPDPQAVQEVLGVFATIAGLAREGKVNQQGLPKNPLQLAATLRVLTRYGGYVKGPLIAVQDFTAASLGRVAEALGYRGVYPQYVGEKSLPDHDFG